MRLPTPPPRSNTVETLAAPQGSQDVTQPAARPLAATLPDPVVTQLGRAGLLGDVLLAVATGDMLLRPSGGDAPLASRPRVAAARRAEFDPRVKALSPGPGASAESSIRATASIGAATLKVGFGWVLVFILLFLAGFSLGTRGLGTGSAR